MKYGYARVSSAGQSLTEQQSVLTAWGCDKISAEKQSGGSMHNRQALETLLDFIGAGDVLCVTRLDRLARSLPDLLAIVERLEKAGATLQVLQQGGIDTATPSGRLFLQILGAIAEFERSLIRDRQAAGIARARAEGRSLGGREKTIPRPEVLRLLAEGVGTAEVARRLRIGRASVYRILDETNRERTAP